MDLLDFEAQDLYFQQEDTVEVQALIKTASENYATGQAELPLLQAYLSAPLSLNVLVSLNRFYYYQHRLEEALLVCEKALAIIREAIDFPVDWQVLNLEQIVNAPPAQLTQIRLYLFTLKAIGFLNMRLHRFDVSQAIFEKLVSVDEKNRIGAQALLQLLISARKEH